jgi:3-deoxy-manno-octulosonate cytidylyltransferase (CMP-KDO synthetase)
MSVLIVIPARFGSTRYPGKPLVELRGASGQPRSLIRRSWDAACRVSGVERVVVATDDARIEAAARGFGADVVMTPESCRNGTERCGAVLDRLDETFEIVVNLQGDAPLTPPWFVEALIAAMRADPSIEVATPVLRCSAEALSGLKEDRRHGRVGATTAVFDQTGRALYFSKEVLPFIGRDLDAGEEIPVFHHVGVYAYRPGALRAYTGFPPGALEAWEGLEQLRFMENGMGVSCIEVEARGHAFWEVNNPADVERVEHHLRVLGLE